jgi:CoA:oxalate CoA-transferase
MGGLLSITGEEGGNPVRAGVSVGDLSAALFLVVGILAAALQRSETGRGQLVDVAMLDSVVAFLENAIVRQELEEVTPGPLGTRHPSIAPFQAFTASDGYLVVAAGNDLLWEKLCVVLGEDHLTTDPRFVTNAARNEHRVELEAELSPIFRTRTVAEWLSKLEEAGIPSGPVNGVDAVVADPQVQAREMLVNVTDDVGNLFRVAASPLRLSERGVRTGDRVPGLGEHTLQVLAERLGMDEKAIAALRAQGVV